MDHATSTGIHNLKLGMWILIGSECMLFGTLIVNYIIQVFTYSSTQVMDGVGPSAIIDVPITSLSTFVLLMSSVTMVLCVHSLLHDKIKLYQIYCFSTAFLGSIFLGFQIYEFSHFYLQGLGLTTNLFGSAFFALTATHGAHVLVGVLIMLLAGVYARKHTLTGKKHGEVVEALGLYWHFVDIVWIVIFTVVYLFVLAPS